MHYELPDFDTLAQMAQDDPKGLEDLRVRLSNELISQAPIKTQRRLHGLQFQIDAHRSVAPTPLAACIKLSQMMHESLSSLRVALNAFTDTNTTDLEHHSLECETEEISSAMVLPFQAQRS